MKTTELFSAALVLSVLVSCEKDSHTFGRSSSDAISMGTVKTTSPLTKAVTEETAQIALEDGSLFNIQKSVEPYTAGPQTRADIKDADNLTSFTLYGYLDAAEIEKASGSSAEDKADNNFISGAAVGKGSDNLWHTDSPYYWRNNITHYFWAQSGASSMTTTANSASFTKEASSEEDIIVAYASKKWNEGMCNDHNGDHLDLDFKHALSAAKFSLGTITYQQRESSTATPEAVTDKDRIQTGEISLIRQTEGQCSVNSALAFDWSETKTNGAKAIVENETSLAVPQNDAALQIIYKDTYTTMTRPVVIPLSDNWQAGHLYNYTINGTVTVPKMDGDTAPVNPGIDLNFTGNEKRSEVICASVNVTYYKTVTISWDTLPSTSGNGTYAFVYYGSEKMTLDKNDIESVKADDRVLFVYNAFKGGTVEKISGKRDGDHITCTLNTESMTGMINFYVAYIGGSNSGSTKWVIKNLEIKVIDYK